jgi:D-xylose transport system substrate-binding protein
MTSTAGATPAAGMTPSAAMTSTTGATPAATSGAAAGAASQMTGKVALLLPDSKTTRYDTKDRPYFEAKMKQLCPNCQVIYNNANGDANAQLSAAESALANGAQVLVVMAVDTTAAAGIADMAKAQGVPYISYSRLTTGSDGVSYAVLFDVPEIGVLQAQDLVKGMTAAGTTNPQIVMINGAPTDSNAALYKQGAHSIFDPLVQAGKLKIAREYDTPDWSPDQAQTEMQQALTVMGNKVDGVYSANDGMASGAIAAMQTAGVNPIPPVVGGDAELAAIQRILTGKQYSTIYLPLQPLAETSAQLAFDLLSKTPVPANLTNGKTVNNGKTDVPLVSLTPLDVTKDTIKDTVVKDNFWTVQQICTAEYAAACKAAGLQ